jgi:hypothetical protein
MDKLCPYLIKQSVVHNTIQNARVSHIGINKYRDNEVIYSTFEPCIKEQCMMYDNKTGQCKRTT